ncbi:hypothetical protein GCM10018953_00770 [Streptosporangium nondiastaticum]
MIRSLPTVVSKGAKKTFVPPAAAARRRQNPVAPRRLRRADPPAGLSRGKKTQQVPQGSPEGENRRDKQEYK